MKLKTKEADRVDVNALLGRMVDRRRDALYDRVRLKAGQIMPETISCFQIPVGHFGDGYVKSWADTNMVQAGMLPLPHDMIIRRVLFLFQPSCSEAARNAFLAAYYWDLRILEKSMARQPALVGSTVGTPDMILENFGKGCWQDPEGERINDSASKMESLAPGVAWDLIDIEDYRKYLPPLVWFAVELRGQPFVLPGDLDFYVMLDGLRDFPVQ